MSTTDDAGNVIPWSEPAEQQVLGGLLMDNEAWAQVGDILVPEHFYAHAHRQVYDVVGALVAASKPADVLTVFEDLDRRGKAGEVGGIPYLNTLAQSTPSAVNIRRYAEIVAERALMRSAMAAADRVRAILTEPGQGTIADRLNDVIEQFQSLQVHRGRGELRQIGETDITLAESLTELAEGRRQAGIATGIPHLDRLLGGGLKPGRQVVLAARPSVGKSSLALAMALHMAAHGHACGYLSLEMEQVELRDRAVANLAEIDLERLATARLEQPEWARMLVAEDDLRRLPLHVSDRSGLSLAEVQAKARLMVQRHSIRVLVLDYLQLCAGNPKADKRHHQIEEISRATKVLAKQLGITVLLLSQLNRDVERRTGGKPILADLKESGSIEEDADVVILLSQSYVRGNGVRVIEAEVAKNRQGRKGSVMLALEGRFQRWSETIADDRPLRPAARHYTEDV